MMTLLLFAEDNQIGFDDYKSTLRTEAEDHKDGVSG